MPTPTDLLALFALCLIGMGLLGVLMVVGGSDETRYTPDPSEDA